MENRKKSHWWWPKISDIETAKQTARYGFWAAVWVASVTAIIATLGVIAQQEVGSINGGPYIDVFLFGVIAWGIKRYSKAFAVVGLGLFVIEKALLVSTLAGAGWIQAAIVLLMFSNGASTYTY